MDYDLSCECGHSVTVTEAAAGREIDCACGRTIKVPSFRELRERAGLQANNVSPALMIAHLLENGELYPPAECVWCGVESDDVMHIDVECERQWQQGAQSTGDRIAAALVFGWFGLLLFWRSDSRPVGNDLIFQLPVTVCPKCRTRFVPESRPKIWLVLFWVLLVCGVVGAILLPPLGIGLLIGALVSVVMALTLKQKQRQALTNTLRQVSLYDQLLERYPEAELRWFRR